jgi:hypothetical protein
MMMITTTTIIVAILLIVIIMIIIIVVIIIIIIIVIIIIFIVVVIIMMIIDSNNVNKNNNNNNNNSNNNINNNNNNNDDDNSHNDSNSDHDNNNISLIFILYFYRVSVTLRFIRVTHVAPIYKFSELFFLIKLEFVLSIFFSYSKNNNNSKIHVIKIYKVHGHVHRFYWLTWFTSLTFCLFFNYFFQHFSTGLMFDLAIVYFCYHIIK